MSESKTQVLIFQMPSLIISLIYLSEMFHDGEIHTWSQAFTRDTRMIFSMSAGITVRRLLGKLKLTLYSLKPPWKEEAENVELVEEK